MALEISEQTFAVPEDAQLKLSNVRGHVTIHAGEAADQIQVKAALDPESGDAERTKVEMHQEENGEVVVKTNYIEPFWGFLDRAKPCRVDFDVTVPANCKIRASTVSAGMDVTGTHAKLDLSTVSGGLELADAMGELSASTVSGALTGRGLGGNLKAHSVSGSVRLESQALGSIDASTVSGSIHLHSPLNAGPYRFHTVSGDFHWDLPEPAACTIEMHTISGQTHVNLPSTRNLSNGGLRTVWVQGGGTKITFDSVSGSFYLVGPEGQPEADQQAVEKQTAEQRSVLERVARGEITPEEGLQALRS